MNLTVKLLRVLGSPFDPTTSTVDHNELFRLFNLSIRNRMLFFYLNKIRPKNLRELVHFFQLEKTNYKRTNDLIVCVSKILTEAKIEHAFFKTIRPYVSTTVDLDILIFGGDEEYSKSVITLKNAGYKILAYGPQSTTFLDKEANIGIDIYREVAVSLMTYMNKRTLHPFVTTIKLPNGKAVKVLKPEADLVCIIAHSLIKEQMYTLSEYYTFIYYLNQININDFLKIIKQNNLSTSARTHSSITALLHKAAHETIPEKLQQITKNLSPDYFETTRLIRNNFETPHKYHSFTVAKALLEIARGKESRDSMALQIFQMLNPTFAQKFLKNLLQHIKRKTY